MESNGWVEQLLELPDVVTQKQFMEQHVPLLDDQVADALKAHADQFLREDLKRSLQTADLLCHMANVTGSSPYRALGLLAEANARSIGLGEYEMGVELYDEAAEIYRKQDRLIDQAKSQIGKVGSLGNLGRYEEALEVAQWANDILVAYSEKRPQATLMLNMGVMHEILGELTKALEVTDLAADLYGQLGTVGEPGLGLAQMNRGLILRSLGRFDESIQASQTAREILTRLDQNVEAARAQQSLALTYFVLGRYNEALDNYDQVREIFLNDGRQPDAVLVELFISDCLLQLRRFDEVLEKCQRVRSLFNELGTQFIVSQAIVNEAVAYAELSRYSDALSSLTEARGIFEAEGNRAWVASTDLEMAAVLLRQGRYEECLAAALVCADDCNNYDLPVQVAQACLVAAWAAFKLKRFDQALGLATKALDVGQERNLPTLKYQAHHIRGALAAAQEKLEDALEEYERAIEELERLRGRLMVEFRVDFLEDKELIYEDMVGLCLSLNRPLRGLEYAERAKSRALLDLLAQRLDLGIQARGEADRPLVDELMRLRVERDRLYRRWESDTEPSEGEWTSPNIKRQEDRQEVLVLEKQITDLWHRLLIHNADYARDASLWNVRTEPIQPYLQDDMLLLEYYVVDNSLVAFLITSDAVSSVRLPAKLAQVQQRIQLLWLNMRAVSHSTASQISHLEKNAQGILQGLYDLLIAPLGDALLPYRRLIVVPHGALHYLPFHALYDGQSYLLQHHEISYLPGASFLRYCSEVELATSGALTVGHSNNGRLPHTIKEARSIAALLGGRAFLEDEATPARIQQAAVDCRVIHFAAHGDFRPDNPLFSGLALADGWLTTLDIFNMRLKASLVTLSACQTGRNVVGGGDELLGLMRAFLSAGAASLALSLWAVEDRSTAQLMEIFYQKMVEGYTKGAALRSAQLQFVECQIDSEQAVATPYTHPYYWASFFLVGDAGQL